MQHKAFDLLEVKADGESGTFEATVAVFGNVDKGGDRIIPGAFKNTLAQWEATGDPIPVILSHQWDDPMAHVGVVEKALETEKGLWVKGRLDVTDNPVARQVHRLMQRRSLKEFSFGYSIPKGGEKRAKDGATDLLEIALAEVGPTLKGMNPATELHAVKSALVERKFEVELQEVKGRLKKLEQRLEDPKSSKAEVTDKAPEARSVDPLRQQAEAVELEFLSDGESLRKPPKTAAPPAPELMPLGELKQRMRDEMLGVLSGGITDE